MKGWREGEEKKVSLLIVSERAQTLVVVGESGLACSGGMRQPRRGADAGNDSDDRFFFSFLFLSFVFRHGVLACERLRQRLLRFAAVYWLVTASRRIN